MKHAKLSPSGASKWLNCPPSANLEAEFPDTSSDYADEGTEAHSLAELLIMYKRGVMSKQAYNNKFERFKDSAKYYSGEMHEYCDAYADFVMEIFNEAKAHTKDAVMIQETEIDLTPWVPEGFGNLDVSIISDRVLFVIDLKYGKGVPVSAVGNKQLMIYALGAVNAYEDLYDFDTVKVFIHQPRIDNSSNHTYGVDYLKQWAENVLKPGAALAWEGGGNFEAGEHCKFCKAKPACRAHAKMQLELAAYEFKEGPLLNEDEIADILSRTSGFKTWLTEVDEYALQEAIKGRKWPGYKLVEGRSTRKITDADKALQALIKAGFKADDVQITELRTITELEKLTGKKQFGVILDGLINKPQGKPTLAPEDDKRPPFNSAEAAAKDFEN